MPSQIEDIIAEFCELSKRKKTAQFSDYQTKLKNAYQGECAFHLTINERGLEEEGGRLLGWFFELYPYIEEVHLKGNMINEYDGRRLVSGIGFYALIEGLSHLKKLRALDLSGDKYTPEQLERLTKNVLMNHPTFTTLTLTTAFITDAHLDAMIPYLSCPQLKTIYLNGNDRYLTDSDVFDRLVDKLLSDCPAIQLIDVSGNASLKKNGLAANALMRLLSSNKNTFVRIPQDERVYQQAMKNRYEHFIPNRVSLMDMDFNKMSAQYEAFQASIEALPEIITTLRTHEVRFTQIDVRMDEEKTQHEQVQKQIQDAIDLQCLKQLLIEQQMRIIRADVKTFQADIGMVKENIQSTQAHVQDLEVRSERYAVEASHMAESMMVLRRKVANQTDTIENLDERMEDRLNQFRVLFDTLEQRMQAHWAEVTQKMQIEDDLHIDLSPTERAYVKKFKYMLVQMHIVAMTACEGTMQLGSSDTAGTALTVLNILSNVAPGPLGGSALSIFSYLLQTSDENNTKQRMEQITQLGASPDEIVQLSFTLSQRLIHCFAIAHHVKKGSLQKLLSATAGIMQSFTEHGFYGALFHAVQDDGALTALTNATQHAFTITEAENRAEQDAKLLLAAVVKEGVPKQHEVVDVNRLFLYAAPMLTMVDRLFLTVLQQFCAAERCDNNLNFKPEKRQQFYGAVAKSWHESADVLSHKIEDSVAREPFIQDLAMNFTTRRHGDGTVGVLYFKAPQTLFNMTQKRHASIRSQALEAAEVGAVLRTTLTTP